MSRLSQRLWQQTLKISAASLYHPLVIQIAQGKLCKKVFKDYMNQDEHFLMIFNICIQKLAEKCDKSDVYTLNLLKKLKGESSSELELHNELLKNIENNIVLNSAAKDYTDNLLHVAETEAELGYLVAALAPCPILYKYIGDNIAFSSRFQSDSDFDEDLRKWITTYSSSDFGKDPTKELIDRFGPILSYRKMLHYYKQSMVLEYKFFDAYNVADNSCPPLAQKLGDKKIVLALDFDKTITLADTCNLIGEAAVKNQSTKSNFNAKDCWDGIVNEYGSGYDQTLIEMKKTPSVEEFCMVLNNYEHLAKLMVSDTKFLAGMSSEYIRSLGKWVQVREGCSELIQKSNSASNVVLKIISANWSSTFINSVLRNHTDIKDISNIEIISSELAVDEDGITTGNISGAVCGPLEKKEQLEKIKTDTDCFTVFVGDSVHDLAALLTADIGIIIGNNDFLKDTCKKYQIKLLPLVSYLIDSTCQSNSKVLFVADSLYDIIAFVFGIKREEIEYTKCPDSYTPRILTVGGSDSGGCSGIQADIKACEVFGVFNMSTVTSVTSQNTLGVHSVDNMDANVVEKQALSALHDFGADVIKTGMLPTKEIVTALANVIKQSDVPYLVIDPIFISSTGTQLVSDEAILSSVELLFPLSTVITPNVHEVSVILKNQPIKDTGEMKIAARQLHKLGPDCVLIKGGHLQASDELVTDVLYYGATDTYYEFTNKLVKTKNSRGTGCTLASAISANLAMGKTVVQSVRAARSYLQQAIQYSTEHCVGRGRSLPLVHSFKVQAQSKKYNLQSQLALYLVTDKSMIESRGSSTASVVEEAIIGGATMVQIRCKDTDAEHFCSDVKEALLICRKHNVPLVVNDRIDVAIACGADGVHVGQSDIKLEDARYLLGHNKIIGVSARSIEEAAEAERLGADYIGAGSVFSTVTKTDTNGEIGLENLEKIAKFVNIPVVAIGGISLNNAADVMNCGVSGIAVVSALLKGKSVTDNAIVLRKVVENNKLPGKSEIYKPFISSPYDSVKRDLNRSVLFMLDFDKFTKSDSRMPSFIEDILNCKSGGVLIKCKTLDGADFCTRLNQLLQAYDRTVIVIDRIDVALVCNAAGVHLESGCMSVADARCLVGSFKLVGVTVHSLQEAVKAEESGADYVIMSCHKDANEYNNIKTVGLHVNIPVIVEGANNVETLESGISGFLVSSEVCETHTLKNIVEHLNNVFGAKNLK